MKGLAGLRRSERRRPLVVTVSLLVLVAAIALAWMDPAVHVGALMVIPLLVIGYLTSLRVALLTALSFGVLVGFLEYGLIPGGRIFHLPTAVNGVIITVSLCVVVYVADTLRKTGMHVELLRRSLEHAQTVAQYDPLTGVANRAQLLERLEESLARMEPGEYVAVLFCDLDRFKEVNDTAGHSVGDRVLALTAARIQNAIRSNDLLARVGGDEFVVLLAGIADTAQVSHVARAIAASLNDPFHIGNREFSIGVTVGMSISPEDGTSADALLAAADADMYRRKGGRRTLTPH